MSDTGEWLFAADYGLQYGYQYGNLTINNPIFVGYHNLSQSLGFNPGDYLYYSGNVHNNWSIGDQNITLGGFAGYTNQGDSAISIGYQTGYNTQGYQPGVFKPNSTIPQPGQCSIAIGMQTGYNQQRPYAISIGYQSAYNNQGQNSISIGNQAGVGSTIIDQSNNAIAIGYQACYNGQGINTIAIGYQAGYNIQGANTIAIGYRAGYSSQASNSIILNASENIYNLTRPGFYVYPIRNNTGYNTTSSFIYSLYWNSSTSEIFGAPIGTTSDYRIKKHVQVLDKTNTVDKLNPVKYFNNLNKKYEIGLIAHELQEVYPFLVNGEKDGKNYQTINYFGLIGILINEIKNIKLRIKKLELIILKY
jgi:hypothetical protein